MSLLPTASAAFKRCAACGEMKPLGNFYRQKSSKTGRHSYCKPCYSARPKARKNDPVKARARNLQTKYGLTMSDVDAMLDEQGNRCRICEVEFQRGKFDIDHDHATGEVRGILCRRCNIAIPILEDYERLVNAIDYLGEAAINRVIDEFAVPLIVVDYGEDHEESTR